MSEHELWRREFIRVLQTQPTTDETVSQGVAGASLCVFSCSTALICFYGFQYRNGRCNLHPIYVQFVTFCVYSLACFGTTDFLYIPIENHAGDVFDLAIGRYLFWMMTCPVIISNVNILLNLMTPDDLELGHVTFMMVKDIVMIAFGVLAAMQKNVTLKWIFNLASYFVCFWLVVDLLAMIREKKKHFIVHERCWEWVLAVMTYFFFAQSLFIFLYAFGPPCFNLMGPDGDKIGHSVGDLFAKNLFGFFAWYVRFVVLEPFVKRIRSARAVTPFQRGSDAMAPHKMRNVSFLNRKTNSKRTKAGPRAPRVLIVEPRIEIQRLFMFILRDAGIEGEIAFDLETASKIVRRDPLTHYDAIVLNLTIAFENRVDTQKFRMHFRRKPFYLPLLGYCFDDTSYGPLVEREEVERNLSDGFIRHILDEGHLYDVVTHWREASSHWRGIDDSADMERRLHQHVQGIHMAPIQDGEAEGMSSFIDYKNDLESQPQGEPSSKSAGRFVEGPSYNDKPASGGVVDYANSPVSPLSPVSPSTQTPATTSSAATKRSVQADSAAPGVRSGSSPAGGRISMRRKSSFESMNDNLRRQLKAEEEQVARLKQQQHQQHSQFSSSDYAPEQSLDTMSPQEQASAPQPLDSRQGLNYQSMPLPFVPNATAESKADGHSGTGQSTTRDELEDDELAPRRRTSLIIKGSMM